MIHNAIHHQKIYYSPCAIMGVVMKYIMDTMHPLNVMLYSIRRHNKPMECNIMQLEKTHCTTGIHGLTYHDTQYMCFLPIHAGDYIGYL